MSLIFTNQSESNVPVCVQGILPESIARLKTDQIAELKVWRGNRQFTLADLFRIDTLDDAQPDKIVWRGDMSRVHWLGTQMSSGTMIVEGNAGRHLGSQMKGGQIQVDGSADDYVGCEMTGGQIRIGKDAGDWLGAAYPGSRVGLNRGTILIGGNAGRGVGFGMRRGLICIAGNVDRLVGWNMLAGNIVVGGQVGQMAAKGMSRGTLWLASRDLAASNRQMLPPSFAAGSYAQPAVAGLMCNWLRELESGVELPNVSYQIFHGDYLQGGRGEVLIASSRNDDVN